MSFTWKGFRYYKNNSFEPSSYLSTNLLQDDILVPTCFHFIHQNRVLSALGQLLGGSGTSWERLDPPQAFLCHVLEACRPVLKASWNDFRAS